MRKHTCVLLGILLLVLSALSYAQAPVPFINLPLVPDATAPGGPQFTLTVNGTGFVSSSVVNWNGNALATQFVSASKLTATVPAADVVTASTASVTVVTPPPGGGTSNVAYFSVTANTGNSVGFALASSPSVGIGPEAVVVSDFNGDGKLDLATGNIYSNTVSILLGDGTGNFTLASTLAVGDYPYFIGVGDFNGDGKPDLATTNLHSNTLSILLGDGAGNFTLASSPVVDSGPEGIAVADFNGDGKLDLAVTNSFANMVSILLGDGTGNFTLTSSSAVGVQPDTVAVGDFNGDGKLDLATADYFGSVSILLGDGTGNFILTSSPVVGVQPDFIEVGDFNGDGKLDLATPDIASSTVSILLGDGAGNFTLASSIPMGTNPASLGMGDFNADGTLDLVTPNYSSNTVSTLLGDGSGNFTLTSSLGVDYLPTFTAVGDFNGDGKLDLAVGYGYWSGSNISILLANPSGPYVAYNPASLTFGPQLIGTSSSPQPVTLTNIGSATVDITKGAISPNYSQTNNCPRQLAPSGTCTANVVFTPRKINTITGAFTITDNAPNSPQTVALSGVGTAVSLSPLSLNFGSQQVGTTSQPQTLTLTNHATAALSIGSIQINPNFAQTNNCGTSVAAGGSCTISVTFTPTRKGSGTVPLVIYDNGGASPQIVLVSGTGT